jgi:hypothetical protein
MDNFSNSQIYRICENQQFLYKRCELEFLHFIGIEIFLGIIILKYSVKQIFKYSQELTTPILNSYIWVERLLFI